MFPVPVYVCKAVGFLVRLASHSKEHYLMVGRKKPDELLYLEEVGVPAYSIFVRSGWRGSHGLRYQAYLLSSGYDLKEVAPSVCRAILAVVKSSAAD